MINHARTLLLNSRETDDPAPWERYMPTSNKLVLPPYLESIRAALVGTDGWWDRTYRVEMLLTMLSSVRYRSFYSWMDLRVTPPLIEPFLYSEPDVSVARVPLPSPDPFVTHIDKPTDKTFPIKRTWLVRGSGSELMNVQAAGAYFTVKAYFDSGLSGWRLPLAVDFDLLFSSIPPETEQWNVRSYKKPQNTFAMYPAIVNSLSSNWTYPMFSAVDPSDTPVANYARWYNECVHAEDRIAGVVLAYLLKATKLLIS